jgi:hypothetical protein
MAPGCRHSAIVCARSSGVSLPRSAWQRLPSGERARHLRRGGKQDVAGGHAEAVDVLRRGALGGIVEQRTLEDQRVRGVGDDQSRDPARMPQRRRPRDRAAPVVAGQREPVPAQRIGQRQHVGDQPVDPVVRLVRRLGGAGVAALIGGGDRVVRREVGKLVPPCPPRFGKAVQEQDGVAVRRAAHGNVERHAGGEGNASGLKSHGIPFVPSENEGRDRRPLGAPHLHSGRTNLASGSQG